MHQMRVIGLEIEHSWIERIKNLFLRQVQVRPAVDIFCGSILYVYLCLVGKDFVIRVWRVEGECSQSFTWSEVSPSSKSVDFIRRVISHHSSTK